MDYIFYLVLAYIAVFITAVAQLLLKLGTIKFEDKKWFRIYLNPYTIFGYFLMFMVTLINLYVYMYLDLKYSVAIIPFTFIFVGILSFTILKEQISKKQLISYLIIIIGVIIFNI